MLGSRSAGFLTTAAWDGNQATVALQGELDFTAARDLSRRLREVVQVAQPMRLVVDLAEVTFLDCAVARAIAGTKAALAEGGVLVIRSPARVPRLVFMLTGLWRDCVVDVCGAAARQSAAPASAVGG